MRPGFARARAVDTLPARFLLVAAMNPCPCGEGMQEGACRCSEPSKARYERRLSGPLLDRFDLAVPLSRPDSHDLLGGEPGESTAAVVERVAWVRLLAAERGVRCNADLAPDALDLVAPLTPIAAELLERRMRSGSLSARGLHRVRRVARTIADLAGVGGPLDGEHVAEALQLRAGRLTPATSRR